MLHALKKNIDHSSICKTMIIQHEDRIMISVDRFYEIAKVIFSRECVTTTEIRWQITPSSFLKNHLYSAFPEFSHVRLPV